MADLMSGVPEKSREMLKGFLRDRIITKEGLEWLIAATDPFHDSQIVLNGFPDVASTNSITQCVVLTQSLSVATGKDLHVFMAPFSQMWGVTNLLSPFYMRDTGANGNANLSGAVMCSGLNLVTVTSGADWRISPTAVTNYDLTLPRSFSYGQFRLISAGWEVVNVSPAINKGGSVTCYRVPNAIVQSYVLRDYSITIPAERKRRDSDSESPKAPNATYPIFATHNAEFGTLPPGTQAQAALFPSSRTWNTSEGLYQVAVMNSVEQNFTSTLPGIPGFLAIPTQSQLESDLDRIAFLPQSIYTTNGTTAFSNNSHLFRYDVSGAVFRNDTGYTQNYQVTVKYFVEKIPTDTDPTLLVLSRPPAPYDPVILEIYSRVMARMPVGVPVGENPLGEWFNEIMDGVATVLPIIGKALTPFFGPASLIGDALGAGAKALATNNRAASAAEIQRRAQQSEQDRKKQQQPIQKAEGRVLQNPSSIVLPPPTRSEKN
jgi:hypothetical protein